MGYIIQMDSNDIRRISKNTIMCHPHMRFGPEHKDLCHHAEQLLSIRV